MSESDSHPSVTIVVPNWNTQRWLCGCLEGLRSQNYRDFRVLVVDSGSTDDSVLFIRENYPEVEVIALAENRGFAAAVNAGIERAETDYVVLLNVDTVPQPNWLSGLVASIEQCPDEIGSLASKMLNLNNPDLIDDAGDSFSWYGSARKRGQGEPASKYTQPVEVFSACAGAALYRRAFFEEVGLFDEGFESYLEDIDLSLRGHLYGYRCLYVPEAEVWHQGQGAGIPRPRYVYLMSRNRLAVLTKNIPTRLLFKHAYTLLFGQIYFFLVYKKPLRSLAGVFSFLYSLPRLLRHRRDIQLQKKVSDQVLESVLSDELGEPSLREIIRAIWMDLYEPSGHSFLS